MVYHNTVARVKTTWCILNTVVACTVQRRLVPDLSIDRKYSKRQLLH